ncbi:MAG: CGNR zinc finger domain-containing protein [Micrococcus sp.]|nr:CGNR zinc finger domain-containing protein [Micrococcus sp.]
MLSARTLEHLNALAVFLNTAPGLHGGRPQEEQLVYGAQLPDVVPALHEGRTKVRVADAAIRRAHALRDQLDDLWTQAAHGEDVTEAINALLRVMGPLELQASEDGVDICPASNPSDAVERLTALAALALTDAAVQGELSRLRQCDGEDCENALVDASRNRSKRFCDEANCGNRMHVRSYRARQAEEGGAARAAKSEPDAQHPADVAGTEDTRIDQDKVSRAAGRESRLSSLTSQREDLKKQHKAAKKAGDKKAKKQHKKDLKALDKLIENLAS